MLRRQLRRNRGQRGQISGQEVREIQNVTSFEIGSSGMHITTQDGEELDFSWIRVIESETEEMDVGSLFISTTTGASASFNTPVTIQVGEGLDTAKILWQESKKKGRFGFGIF